MKRPYLLIIKSSSQKNRSDDQKVLEHIDIYIYEEAPHLRIGVRSVIKNKENQWKNYENQWKNYENQ